MYRMVVSGKFSVFLFLLCFCISGYGASFLCTSNSSVVENFICSESSLSKKDTEMALIYQQLLGRKIYVLSKQELIAEQRKWLRDRNACTSLECLNKIYDSRIGTLREYQSYVYEVKVSPPLCIDTVISGIGPRLEGADPKQFGTSIHYKNYVSGVSYSYIPAISERSRINDPVKVCLVSRFENCPKGDDRGKTYRATNLRTKESWELPDSQHICGGA
ncbi:MAG: hypothetical protein RI928_518 [Pseudomonadota bacterium]